MRSLLFVPADSERKLARALGSGADVLLLDLEDSVAPADKPKARKLAADFIREHRGKADRPRLFVRVNAFDTGMTDEDVHAAIPAGAEGVMLPKSLSGADVARLAARMKALEPSTRGGAKIIAIAAETAVSLFGLGSYGGVSDRLNGLTWGSEDLAASLGAQSSRDDSGALTEPYRLARTLCLIGAAAAQVAAIDTVHVKLGDSAGLRRECIEAARDGFTAKLAIHPDQVAVINEAFTPSPEELARARAVVDAFTAAGDAGVIAVGGQMLDRPHLAKAEKLLARAAALKRGG